MGKYIDELLSLSSDSLCVNKAFLSENLKALADEKMQELNFILQRRNGFFAFESALRFFPSQSSSQAIGLPEWNAEGLWRKDYGELTNGYLFFAEDIFGVQFCIKDNLLGAFNPETAEFEEMAPDFENWAKILLDDFNYWTGHSLAREWQDENGAIPADYRLIPKIPFVTGGEFELTNLFGINAVNGMRTRGNLARQIQNLTDGGQVSYPIIE